MKKEIYMLKILMLIRGVKRIKFQKNTRQVLHQIKVSLQSISYLVVKQILQIAVHGYLCSRNKLFLATDREKKQTAITTSRASKSIRWWIKFEGQFCRILSATRLRETKLVTNNSKIVKKLEIQPAYPSQNIRNQMVEVNLHKWTQNWPIWIKIQQ